MGIGVRGQTEIQKHFDAKMSKRVEKLRDFAGLSLMFGPMDRDQKKADGFPAKWTWSYAVDELRSWWAEHGTEVYYDNDIGVVLEEKPEAYEDEETGEIFEPFWEEIYKYDKRQAAMIVFGTDLGEHVR